jgi:hypothetical protein
MSIGERVSWFLSLLGAVLVAGRDLLARWTYTADEWNVFAPGETRRLANDKGMLLKIMAGFMLVATVATVLISRRATLFVGGILGGIWILCWAIVRMQVHRQNKLEQAPPKSAITYSTPGRNRRPTETVCVPIPTGREAEAAALVKRLAARR